MNGHERWTIEKVYGMQYWPVNPSREAVRTPNDPLLFSAKGDDPRRSLRFLSRSSLLGTVEGYQ
jgi:hypothetical protein